MNVGRLLTIGVTGLVLLAPDAARALTFSRVPSLDELSATAPLIVRGRVVAIEHDVIRTDATHAQPITAVHIAVLSGLRGEQAGDQITLRHLGGPVTPDGRKWLYIGGMPRYALGEEVLAFVDDRTHPFFGTAYADAGLLRIASDANGRRLVMNARWQVLVAGAAGPTLDGTSCRPATLDHARCTRTASVADAYEDVGGPAAQPLAPVTVDAIEARILAHRGTVQAGAAQTVTASAPVFAQAVAAMLRHDVTTIRQLTGRSESR